MQAEDGKLDSAVFLKSQGKDTVHQENLSSDDLKSGSHNPYLDFQFIFILTFFFLFSF